MSLLLSACHTIINPPPPTSAFDQWGCRVPANAVIASTAGSLELASVSYRDVSVKGVKVANDPKLQSLLSDAARDASARDYLRCLAKRRDGFSNEEVLYIDRVNSCLMAKSCADNFVEWQKSNPPPDGGKAKEEQSERRRQQEEVAARIKQEEAAAQRAIEEKAACRVREFQKCMTRDPRVYPTYNQVCNDPRTHYLVRRQNRVEMAECYGLPNYGDCVGKCVQHGDALVEQVCRGDANRNCGG